MIDRIVAWQATVKNGFFFLLADCSASRMPNKRNDAQQH
jgi:hypothetical protein